MKINWKYFTIGAIALVVIGAIVVTAILLAGKGNNGPKVVGVFISDSRIEQEKIFADQIVEQLERNNFAVKTYNANADQSVQNQQFAELMESDCEAVLLCPVMPDATAELVQQAKEKGVPLIFFGREPAKEILDQWDRLAYVGCNAGEVGKLQGQLILNQNNKGDINGDGVVSYVLLRDSKDSAATTTQFQGAVDTLGEGVGVSLLNDACSGNDRIAANKTLSKVLAGYGKDIEVVICANDTVALGAMDAISEGGRVVGENIYLIGADGFTKSLEYIHGGKITGTVLCDLHTQAEKLAELTQELLTQPATEKRYYVNHITVTAENAEEYLK